MTNYEKREEARRQYRPEKTIEFLLIAEAPPGDPERFFYFSDVQTGDSLFLQTMKVLYPGECKKYKHAKDIRRDKDCFLKRFQKDGFYLIDAVDEPFGKGLSPHKKVTKIRELVPALLKKIEKITGFKDGMTKIILVSHTVYDACFDELRTRFGLSVSNYGPIPFPGSGWQRDFNEKMRILLRSKERNTS